MCMMAQAYYLFSTCPLASFWQQSMSCFAGLLMFIDHRPGHMMSYLYHWNDMHASHLQPASLPHQLISFFSASSAISISLITPVRATIVSASTPLSMHSTIGSWKYFSLSSSNQSIMLQDTKHQVHSAAHLRRCHH